MSRVLTALSLLFACVIAVGAEQPTPDPRLRARFGALRAGGNPYQQLFSASEVSKPFAGIQEAAPAKPAPADPAKPRVVCGMTIVPAKPNADPKMVLEP